MSKKNASPGTRHKARPVNAVKRGDGRSRSKSVEHLERSSKRFASAMKALAKR